MYGVYRVHEGLASFVSEKPRQFCKAPKSTCIIPASRRYMDVIDVTYIPEIKHSQVAPNLNYTQPAGTQEFKKRFKRHVKNTFTSIKRVKGRDKRPKCTNPTRQSYKLRKHGVFLGLSALCAPGSSFSRLAIPKVLKVLLILFMI